MNRIKAIRESQNLTQAKLGEMVGTSDATIQRLETGKRQLTQEWMEKIALALRVSAAELLGALIPPESDGLVVKGSVWAGVWRESFDGDEDYPPLPIGRDPRYSHADQFALKVKGTSMNRLFPEGQFLVCVAWADVGREVRDGDLVIVHRHDGDKTESTVKRARIQGGKIKLWPESTDPKWQLPIEYDGDGQGEHIEVEIKGLVIGRYEPL